MGVSAMISITTCVPNEARRARVVQWSLAMAALAILAVAPPALAQTESIVAVVNGDVITRGDVEARGRLFALSTGLPVTREVLDRLKPQIRRQLIDERLRLQEEQRRKIAVQDQDIADAINEIERNNNMQRGALRAKLSNEGVTVRTLIDQIRVQLGWTRVLRDELGSKAQVTDAEINDQLRILKEGTGQTEYRVAEIFIPVDDPTHEADASKFADTVIQQLRAGAPFPVVAAQFSQSQTALQGGDLGWQRINQIDPDVSKIVSQMPAGAISNPLRVPGGFSIVTLRGKREVGREQTTVLSVRQAFFPFTAALDPANPTEQQKKQLEAAAALSRSARSCDQIEAAGKAAGSNKPTDPGELRLEQISSAPLRAMLSNLPPGQASRPVVAGDGIAVVMICSRDQKAVTEPARQEISAQLLNERVELTARQLQRDLRRRAVIDLRS